MQISNKRCPYCSSKPVEVLITIGHTSHYECLSCFKTWASEIPQPDIIYGDELNHFSKTGELI